MDEFTADAWHDVLGCEPWLTLEAARAAVVEVKRRQPFVDVSEVIAEAKRARGRQLAVERSKAVIDPVRRRQLHDPRPARDTIRSILSRFGRPELMPASAPPPASADVKPRPEQLRDLEQWMGTS